MGVEIGTDWDPAAHDYGNGGFLPSTGPGREMAGIMGITTLAALSAVGVGAYFSAAAVGTGVTSLGEGVVVNGTTYYGVSQSTAAILNALETAGAGDTIAMETMNAALEAGLAAKVAISATELSLLAASLSYAGAIGSYFPSGM